MNIEVLYHRPFCFDIYCQVLRALDLQPDLLKSGSFLPKVAPQKTCPKTNKQDSTFGCLKTALETELELFFCKKKGLNICSK